MVPKSVLRGGVELAVGCAVADARLPGLTVMLQPPSATTTTQAAASRTRRTDLASGISTILVGGLYDTTAAKLPSSTGIPRASVRTCAMWPR